ncbi:sugar phosphate isomerase/epimerase family protein [Prosthecomicrobium sp. N25]|uniref:sugar phosphate isomerase/epimerase family protein n=1 Tax=Prosthecomicrobium sp. N25 TaxID=3129254 RepID=UPI0030786DD6
MSILDRLSFQLYSARFIPSLEDQFAMLARIGYRLVEPFGGLLGEPDRLRGLLDKHGMTAPSCHVGLDRFRADARATTALLKSLGVEIALVPAPPPNEREKDAEGWAALGRELAEIGKVVTGEGLRFGWHNHHWEFQRTADGRLPLDLMFDAMPGAVWEADLAWIVRGGADPIAEVAKRADRLVAVHVKDIAPAGECADEDGWADVGHGVLDWPSIMAAVAETPARLFVVEHDKPNDAERFARRSYETIARW